MKTEIGRPNGTVSWLVRRYVASRTDITVKARQQYEWAIPHIENGLGAIQLSRLDREDVATWIDGLAAGGKLGRRSIQICRTVLRAALTEAVDEGLIPRSPAARVGLPRTVAKAGSSCPGRTIARSPRSSTTPGCHGSRPTDSGTPQRPTWSRALGMSASSERSPICSATAPRC